jgi:uncharacterized protein YbjT (DUF2867 family)
MAGYVIAGATGQVGSVVAEELIIQGQQVAVLARDASRSARGPGAASPSRSELSTTRHSLRQHY